MRSHATRQYQVLYEKLPADIQRQARQSYKLFRNNPHHPSLQFKRIHRLPGVWSVRVNDHYRALGRERNGELYWFWIGTHNEYDKLV